MMKSIFLLVICAAISQYTRADQPVTVTTQYGDLLGYQTDVARVFYGIPFAQPPVEHLR